MGVLIASISYCNSAS